MYALVKDGILQTYPYTPTDVKRDNPGTSFPHSPSDTTLANFGAVCVVFTNPPVVDTTTHVLQEASPVYSSDNARWEQVWDIRALTAEELQARQQQLQSSIVGATQLRLDTFANTRNYDSILSAATYATSPTPKFQAEGAYAVDCRDTTWAALYQLMADVQAGVRPMPTSFAEIEPELPVLVWP
jgi:hypothetical protein